MKLSDIDLYHMPIWMNKLVEELEETSQRELMEESSQYGQMAAEEHELLTKFRFISTLIDRDYIAEGFKLDVEEARALSRFLALEADRGSLMQLKMYLLGSRHTLEYLELAGAMQRAR